MSNIGCDKLGCTKQDTWLCNEPKCKNGIIKCKTTFHCTRNCKSKDKARHGSDCTARDDIPDAPPNLLDLGIHHSTNVAPSTSTSLALGPIDVGEVRATLDSKYCSKSVAIASLARFADEFANSVSMSHDERESA